MGIAGSVPLDIKSIGMTFRPCRDDIPFCRDTVPFCRDTVPAPAKKINDDNRLEATFSS
jgi:hypothetical protein